MNKSVQLPGGETIEVTLYDVARFWSKVEPHGPRSCWLWKGARDRDGYGMFGLGRKGIGAHRFAYLVSVGPIPEGSQVDHVWESGCRHRACVNPAHLEPVTRAENMRRSAAARTHCKQGHEYTEENTYQRVTGRECHTCRRERAARGGGVPMGERTHCPQGHPYSGENLYQRPSGARECRTCRRERTA